MKAAHKLIHPIYDVFLDVVEELSRNHLDTVTLKEIQFAMKVSMTSRPLTNDQKEIVQDFYEVFVQAFEYQRDFLLAEEVAFASLNVLCA